MTTKAKKKVRIPDISATRTRSTARASAQERRVTDSRRPSREKFDQIRRQRHMLALHPDDVELFADKQGWKEGEQYYVDMKAKRLKLGNTDEEE